MSKSARNVRGLAAAIIIATATASSAQVVEGHPSAGGTAYSDREIATAGAIGEQIRAQRAEPVFIANETDAAKVMSRRDLLASASPIQDRSPSLAE